MSRLFFRSSVKLSHAKYAKKKQTKKNPKPNLYLQPVKGPAHYGFFPFGELEEEEEDK